MKKSFEDRLSELAGPPVLKEAKALLKSEALTGAWRDREGRLHARFHAAAGPISVCVRTGETPEAWCDCRRLEKGLCAHAVALILYGGRFNPKFAAVPEEEKASYYGGLKQESLPMLANRARTPLATLTIDAAGAFPHVPSKWENAVLSVKLHTPGREYLGNLNNLRQLYFDKSLTVTLKLEHFSLHEQQIIRFLAINGEAENSQILLNAEATAEFFHCLVGFPRFTRSGRQLHVRGGFAEAVLLRRNDGKLCPGIRVDGAALPTAGAKVITGRAGCWIGREGEYFFVPATCEISWLRNFFRSTVQSPPEGMTSEQFLASFPLPVIDVRDFSIPGRDLGIRLDGTFPEPNRFELRIEYLYRHEGHLTRFAPESGRLVAEAGRFWKRDEAAERMFENELALFGFSHENNAYTIDGAARIGTFLDLTLPCWMERMPALSLAGRLAARLRGADGVPPVELRCRLLAIKQDGYAVGFELAAGREPADWKSCIDAARSGENYLVLPGAGPVKIPAGLSLFLAASGTFLRRIDPVGRTFEVPFFAAAYYTHLTRNIPGAMIPEIAAGPESPIRTEAGPPYKLHAVLRNYQREGVRFLQSLVDRNFNAVLADEMGLGKTVQLLALLASRKERSGPPALIVCPASLVDNWVREANRFVPEFRVAAPRGNERDAVWKSMTQYDLVILSYAAARLSAPQLRKFHFSFLVLDEAQHIKNPGSSNAKNCKSIEAAHRIVLTGTPLENSPEDLWSIMDFLQPGLLGTLPAFRRYYAEIRERADLRDDLAARIGPFIKRRTKREVAADLPPKTERTVFCEMEPEQRALYEKIRREGLEQLAGIAPGDTRGNAAVFNTLLRLRQICCHPALLPGGVGKGIPSAKTELLLELLHEHFDSGHKVLLFSQFTSLLALTIPELETNQIPFEYLDGSTRNRQQRVDHFNRSPEIPLFLLSLKAGGTGLNLTGADTVIIYDPWWNPAVELQAADRTHRIGQTKPVTSLKLVVKDSIEEKILELQERKQQMFDAVIDNPEAAAAFSIEELRFLLEEREGA